MTKDKSNDAVAADLLQPPNNNPWRKLWKGFCNPERDGSEDDAEEQDIIASHMKIPVLVSAPPPSIASRAAVAAVETHAMAKDEPPQHTPRDSEVNGHVGHGEETKPVPLVVSVAPHPAEDEASALAETQQQERIDSTEVTVDTNKEFQTQKTLFSAGFRHLSLLIIVLVAAIVVSYKVPMSLRSSSHVVVDPYQPSDDGMETNETINIAFNDENDPSNTKEAEAALDDHAENSLPSKLPDDETEATTSECNETKTTTSEDSTDLLREEKSSLETDDTIQDGAPKVHEEPASQDDLVEGPQEPSTLGDETNQNETSIDSVTDNQIDAHKVDDADETLLQEEASPRSEHVHAHDLDSKDLGVVKDDETASAQDSGTNEERDESTQVTESEFDKLEGDSQHVVADLDDQNDASNVDVSLLSVGTDSYDNDNKGLSNQEGLETDTGHNVVSLTEDSIDETGLSERTEGTHEIESVEEKEHVVESMVEKEGHNEENFTDDSNIVKEESPVAPSKIEPGGEDIPQDTWVRTDSMRNESPKQTGAWFYPAAAVIIALAVVAGFLSISGLNGNVTPGTFAETSKLSRHDRRKLKKKERRRSKKPAALGSPLPAQ